MGKINIFTDEEWEHIKKHNKCKTIKQLVKSLYDNPCEVCRRFYLRLFAMHVGFLVQPNFNYYVLKRPLEKAIMEVLNGR